MRANTILIAAVLTIQVGIIFLFWVTRSGNEEYSPQSTPVSPQSTPVDPHNFDVNGRGFWEGVGATKKHLFDKPLAVALVTFFKTENAKNLLDLGAGLGNYSNAFMENGFFVSCYDGNPKTQLLTEGRCSIIDLSQDINLMQHEWVMSLEVGEHIPAQFESNFIRNLHKLNKKGLIVSWAVEGQGGTAHVNCRNNDYVKEKFRQLGYTNDVDVETMLRSKSTFGWFKNTVMVFRK